MKKIIFILGIFLFIASCNEDKFLKEFPRDDIFAENLYISYEGFTNGIYGLMDRVRLETTNDHECHAAIWKIGTDMGFGNNTAGVHNCFNDYGLLNPETKVLENSFSWLYEVINTANMIINRANADDIDWQGNEEGAARNKGYIIGTARLIRAWAYRHLTNSWGPVPLNKEEVNGSNYRNDWDRAPVADIHKLMEEDWIFARDNLAMVEETGFPNSAVASHYLAELYLLQGRFAESETEAKRVIESGEYQLMTTRFGKNASNPGVPFMDLFSNDSREDGNLEVLWTFNNAHESIVGSRDGGLKNMWQAYSSKGPVLKKLDADTVYFYNGGRGRCRAAITDSAFGWYESFDDRYSEYAVKKFYLYPRPGQPSVLDTVEWTNMNYSKDSDLEDNFTWPWVRKWEYIDPEIFENADRPISWESEMYLRLANTYLILAEALFKDGKSDEAVPYLNAIRSRSNASTITAADVNIEFILKERSRELASEEHRKYHLNRNGVFVEWTVKYNPRIEGVGIDIFEHNDLFPIPQGVIDANTGAVMEQNPGYY